MEFYLYLAIAMIVQLVILYLIIRSGTKSETIVQQNDQIIKLLQIIAVSSNPTPAQLFNVKSKYIKAKMPGEIKNDDSAVVVSTSKLYDYHHMLPADTKQRLLQSMKNGENEFEINVSELYKIL